MGGLYFLPLVGMADSRISLDLLPTRSCLGRSCTLRAVEERWSRGEGLGTNSSLVGTAAQAAAGLQLKHNKRQEPDMKERFIGGI